MKAQPQQLSHTPCHGGSRKERDTLVQTQRTCEGTFGEHPAALLLKYGAGFIRHARRPRLHRANEVLPHTSTEGSTGEDAHMQVRTDAECRCARLSGSVRSTAQESM